MSKFTLAFSLVLFASLQAIAATPKHVYVVGGCNAIAQDAVDLFSAQEKAPEFVVYIVCNSADWHTLAVKNDFQESNISFTVLHKGMIWLGPKALVNSSKLSEAIRHELEHLRCDCDLGE